MAGKTRAKKKVYTYGDYLTWPDEERWEILDGEPYAMTGPGVEHQRVSRELAFQLATFLRGKTCEVFTAPLDVLLPKGHEAEEKVTTVVQPDILVVCDSKTVMKYGIRGAPDLVIEILSPSTASHDQVRKRRLYEKHGVGEFWVVDPGNRLVTVYRRFPRENPHFTVEIMDITGLCLEVAVLPGLVVEFDRVLPPPPPVVRESPRAWRATASV
jgi:Uma2 family endonuclease